MFDLYLQKLLEIGHPIEYIDYEIQNIVACYKHQNKTGQYRDEIRNVGANIFHTGSCVIPGAKCVATVNTTADIIRDMLDFLCDSASVSW